MMRERIKQTLEMIENGEDFLNNAFVQQTFDMIRDRIPDRDECMQVNIPFEHCDVLKLLLVPMPIVAHKDEEGAMVMTFDWFDPDMGQLAIDFVVAVNEGVKMYGFEDEDDQEYDED